MPSEKARISKRSIAQIPTVIESEYKLWDVDLKGFCVRAFPSGKRVYYVRFRRGRTQGWRKIANSDAMTPEQARHEARQLLAAVARGELKERNPTPTADEMTVEQLIERYLTEGRRDRPDKRESSWLNDKAYAENHIIPVLGKKKLKDLTPKLLAAYQQDVATGKSARRTGKKKSRGISGGPSAATHALRSLSTALTWAVEQEIIDSNPAFRVRKRQEPARQRFMSVEEAQRMFKAMDELLAEGDIIQDHADCLELIFLTGARKSEICQLKWMEVDFDRKMLILPPARHKTGGANAPKSIPLADRGIEILASRKGNDSEFVFPAPRSAAGHVVNVNYTWSKIRKRAKLDGFRIHDFRHAYASFAINAGMPLKMIGENLGHKRSSTTERYAHLLIDARRPVAEGVAKIYEMARKR